VNAPKKQIIVTCPACGKSALYDEKKKFRPFCSERCRIIDLAKWATDSYRIPVENATPTDQDTE
jgi:uncharacterized protein